MKKCIDTFVIHLSPLWHFPTHIILVFLFVPKKSSFPLLNFTFLTTRLLHVNWSTPVLLTPEEDMAQPQLPAARLPIPAINPYKEHPGDATVDFRQWTRRFQLYLEMVEQSLGPGGALTNAQKNSYLCAHLGTEGLRIFDTNPIMAQRAQTPHEQFLVAATAQFAPRKTLAKAVFDFHSRKQLPDEPVDDVLASLRALAVDCTYRQDQDRLDQDLMIQLIEGALDKKTQCELLATADLSLERTLAIMRANETAQKESAQMGGTNPAQPVQKVQRGKGNSKGAPKQASAGQARPGKCNGCGKAHFHDQCPAKDKQCNSCGKMGHFASVCRSKPRGQTGPQQRQNANYVDTSMLHVSTPSEVPIQTGVWLWNGKGYSQLTLEADTGAVPTTIRESTQSKRERRTSSERTKTPE